ncbi:MAG: hypothetical protein JHC98_02785 [Thermoleophilaceae bacterium]|nr:hypothetical protein [Thermoleophilaceae bacterium]
MINAIFVALVVAGFALLQASSANAQADSFHLGNGTAAGFTASAGTTTLNHVAPITAAASAGATSVTIGTERTGSYSSVASISTNRLVLVIQSTGFTGTATDGSPTAIDLTSNSVGDWELARVSGVAGSTVSFDSPLIHSYTASGAQIVSIPEFTTATIGVGNTVNGPAWNGASGGFVGFLATGAITVNGTLTAAGIGFRGGTVRNTTATGCTQLVQGNNNRKGEGIVPAYFDTAGGDTSNGVGAGNKANGAGGGDCAEGGGAGGGSAGTGGKGGNTSDGNRPFGGYGGAPLTYSPYNHFAFGGGGGSGDDNSGANGAGGASGGVVFIRGASLAGTGTITAAGANGANSTNRQASAGGGGAGGVVYARFTGALNCSTMSVAGGNGGSTPASGLGGDGSPGGGGAGGYALIQGASIGCTPSLVSGVAGTNPSGAADGATPTVNNSPGNVGQTTAQPSALVKPVATITSPTGGSSTSDTTPTITGTGTAGATQSVYFDGVLSGSVVADGSGNWSYTPGSALGSGSHSVYAIPVLDSMTGDASSAVSFTIDTVAPSAPTITSPAAATSYTSDTTPLVSGTAEANSTVKVYDGAGTGTLIGTTTADGSGNWSLSTSLLATGSHTIHATSTDAANNVSADSGTKTIVIDTTSPTVVLTTPANGSVTNDTTPAIAFSVTETNPGTSACIVDGGSPFACTSGSSLSALAEGSHNLTIQHTDLAGNVGTSATNTFTIDTTAPVAPSINSPVSPFTTNDQTPTFSGLAEPDNWVYIYVDGVLNSITFSDGSGNWTMDLGTVAVGTHSVYAESVDDAGNTSPQSAPSRSLTIDTTAPSVSVTSPASDGLTVGPNGNFAFTATDAVGPVTTTCQIDATPAVSCTSPYAYGPLASGGHSLTVTAIDAAGNSAAAVRTFTVDDTPPNTNITSNPASVTNSTTGTFSFTATEGSSTFECVIDSDPIGSCTSPKSYVGLSEGSHTFQVRATDQYGNIDLTPASYTWTIDTTAPIAPTISTPGSDVVTSDTTPAIGGLAEIGSTVNVYEGVTLIGTAVADGSGNWSLSPDPTLSVGAHALVARATDPAGNVSPDSGTRTITIDTSAPTVTLTTPVAGTTPADGSTINTTTPVITFTVSDSNPSPASECIIDGGAPVVCTSGYSPAALGEGSHTVQVTHTDLAGNVGSSTTNTFTVDTVAPAAPVITSGPSAPVASTTAAFEFTGEVGATFECYIDSPINWVACSSPETYTGLDQGAHTFHVRQTDAGGNVSSESTRSWSVDTVGPPAPSVSGPTGTVGSTSATINFNDSESPVTYMCSLDGAPASACTDPESLSGLSDGPHSYEVYAVDALGNAGASTTINWTVDSSLFTAGITAGPLGTVATSDNSLSFTATILSGTTFECDVDGGGFAPCTSPFTTGPLADGSHTFSVYAVNGSQNSPTVTRTWSIDTAGPSLSITAPTDLETVGPNGNVTFSATDATGPITYTCQIDSDPAVSCGSPFVFTGLSDGAHSVTVVATDGVSNSSPEVRNFNVDATSPVTSITDNPPSVTSSTGASFSFTSSESPSTFECSIDGGPIAPCSSPQSYSGLSEATHTFSVRAIDQYGNVDQTPETYIWTIDTTAPVPPSINPPATDIITTDTTPSIGGLAEADSTVNVYDGVTLIGTATADGTGAWSLSPDPTFTEGPHVIVARATDEAGNTSTDSDSRTITIDTIAPVVNITSPTTGSVTNDSTPDIVFTATDTNLTLVQCSVDGDPPVNCTSAWTTPTLSDGLHTVSVLGADGTGSQQTVDTVTFTVDTIAPDAPVITSPATDISTTNLRPTISGTADLGTEITIYDDTTVIGTTTTDGSGNWSFTPTSDFAESAHPIHVTATDAADNTSADSNIRTIIVDLTAPAAPVINDPAADASTNSVRPPIGGTAEPNSTITVYDDTTEIGTATADGAGDWAFTPSSDLSESAHPFHVTATDAAGNTGPDSNVRTLTVDLTAPAAPSITTPAQDLTTAVNTQTVSGTAEPNSTVTVNDGPTLLGTTTADGSGNWSLSPDPTFSEGVHPLTAWATDEAGNTSSASDVRVITIDNTAPLQPEIDSPVTGDQLADDTPTVTGTAEPNADVDVYDGPTLICSTTADALGDWSCTPTTPLSEGDHALTAKATDPSGNESGASDPVDVTIDVTNPSVSISSPVNGSTVTTQTPDVNFSATDDNLDTVECKVDSDSYVACTSPWTTPNLADGSHTVSVQATDLAGNVAIATSTFTVDTTAPTTTIGTKPGALDNDTTPTFTFTANESGSTFECRIDAGAFAPCTSPFTASPALSDGSHTFEVRATDTHGNTESPAQSYTWTVDATPPAKPVVTVPTAGITTSDNTPTISGTAEPNSSVQVFVDGNSVGTATANGSGAWTINSTTLTDGPHNATARATDEAGNISADSDAVAFTVDTTPPGGSVAEVPGSGGGGTNPTFNISTPDGTATIACSLDGSPSTPCSSPFTPTGTLAPGTHTLVVTFTDPVGNVTTRTITFVIAGSSVAPPNDSDPLPAGCFAKGIAISNLAVVGGKVKVSGFARLSYVGKTVSLTYKPTGSKIVATGVVAADGSFSASASAPAKKLRLSNKTLYRATVGDESTPWTKLARRVASSTATYSNGKLIVSGQLTKPLMPKAPVTITARTGCNGPWVKIATGPVKRNGLFSTATSYKVSTGVVFVRVAAVVSKGGTKPKALRTYSFVMPVVLR